MQNLTTLVEVQWKCIQHGKGNIGVGLKFGFSNVKQAIVDLILLEAEVMDMQGLAFVKNGRGPGATTLMARTQRLYGLQMNTL